MGDDLPVFACLKGQPQFIRQSTADTQGRVPAVGAGGRTGHAIRRNPSPAATLGRSVRRLRLAVGPGWKSRHVPMDPNTPLAFANKLRRTHRYSQPAPAPGLSCERPAAPAHPRRLAHLPLRVTTDNLGSIPRAKISRFPTVQTAESLAVWPHGAFRTPHSLCRSNDGG